MKMIERDSIPPMKQVLNLMFVSQTGYVWLSQNGDNESLSLVLTTSTNQDAPMTNGLYPILILDVWEHAYYLKHQNKRDAYIDEWWNVVDWNAVQGLSDWWLERAEKSRDEL